MRFSIVTVCRNSEKVLPRAMDSLAAQKYSDYEWIVIDGKSSDATVAIAQSFSSAPTRIISEPDAGIYDAMNKSLTLASGEYVYFLNSDDSLYDENVLDRVNRRIEDGPDVDLLYGKVVHVKADGKWLRDFSHVKRHNILEEGICHQAIFARRKLFQTIGGFNLTFKLNADYDWIIRALYSEARYACIDERIAYFSDGGAHTRDMAFLVSERQAVRLQYIGRTRLTLRLLRARIANRLHRIRSGHALGIVPLPARQAE
jgi:glycosyltransferase involved in cell wall biosynthesis